MRGQTWLILEDGSVFAGQGFAAPAPLAQNLPASLPSGGLVGIGEIVFNTAMIGYHEVLSDPSYTGQLVAMTYPHIGNYGVLPAWSESGPAGSAESLWDDARPVKLAAFVLRSLYSGPVPAGRQRLEDYLQKHGIPGITGVDTRRLTLHVRECGSATALLLRSVGERLSEAEQDRAQSVLQGFPSMEGRNLLSSVGLRVDVATALSQDSLPTERRSAYTSPLKKRYTLKNIAIVDCGTKANIIRSLHALGADIRLYPSSAGSAEILAGGHNAVLISNGPGDPAVLSEQIQTIRELIGNIPVFGICLGHQLIASALGARIFKMKFGHHGINQPVRDERTGRVFVTSQNHGFAVEESPENFEVCFRNANDGTVEGLRKDSLSILTSQFHPESAPGPQDSLWIFEEFMRAIPGQEEV